MVRHYDPDKARRGYKYCEHCGVTYSPEAGTPSKGSWASTMKKESTDNIYDRFSAYEDEMSDADAFFEKALESFYDARSNLHGVKRDEMAKTGVSNTYELSQISPRFMEAYKRYMDSVKMYNAAVKRWTEADNALSTLRSHEPELQTAAISSESASIPKQSWLAILKQLCRIEEANLSVMRLKSKLKR